MELTHDNDGLAAARSSERTVVFAHCGSAIVVDARYLGFVFKASAIGCGATPLPLLVVTPLLSAACFTLALLLLFAIVV